MKNKFAHRLLKQLGFRMIFYKNPREIEIMRKAAKINSQALGLIASIIEEGMTLNYLDKKVEEFIRDNDALPGFLGLYDYKYTLCTSKNDCVVHGLPDDKPLKNGDIISMDCGTKYKGYYADHAYTFHIGEIPQDVKNLLTVTKQSLYLGIDQVRVGNRIGDIGHAIQSYTESHGYGVVRELCGHGIGKRMHEEPNVPNFGKPKRGKMIKNGMCLALEPMINMGTHKVGKLDDGWSIVTEDGLPSAHFEHDVAVVNGKAEILTTYDYVESALQKRGIWVC